SDFAWFAASASSFAMRIASKAAVTSRWRRNSASVRVASRRCQQRHGKISEELACVHRTGTLAEMAIGNNVTPTRIGQTERRIAPFDTATLGPKRQHKTGDDADEPCAARASCEGQQPIAVGTRCLKRHVIGTAKQRRRRGAQGEHSPNEKKLLAS